MDIEKAKKDWLEWLKVYGADKFLDAFMRTAHGAESTCIYCKQPIYLDMLEGGGVADWGTTISGVHGLDYGCSNSPDTDEEGTGGHMPRRLNK
jgi:hypothetical protein